VVKPAGCWHKNRHEDQRNNRTPRNNTTQLKPSDLYKGVKKQNKTKQTNKQENTGEKTDSSTTGAGKNGYLYAEG
jgi:hypothetical protein